MLGALMVHRGGSGEGNSKEIEMFDGSFYLKLRKSCDCFFLCRCSTSVRFCHPITLCR